MRKTLIPPTRLLAKCRDLTSSPPPSLCQVPPLLMVRARFSASWSAKTPVSDRLKNSWTLSPKLHHFRPNLSKSRLTLVRWEPTLPSLSCTFCSSVTSSKVLPREIPISSVVRRPIKMTMIFLLPLLTNGSVTSLWVSPLLLWPYPKVSPLLS